VEPFVEAIEKQNDFYYEHELDMFRDGISIPGLAEKIKYKYAFSKLNKFRKCLKNYLMLVKNFVWMLNELIKKLKLINSKTKRLTVLGKMRSYILMLTLFAGD
jgi:hypothetical protein